MATVQIEKRKRGVFGWAIAIVFWGFQGLMVWWFFAASVGMSGVYEGVDSDAGRAGAAIGMGIGITMIFVIWGAGSLIFGMMMLVTRGKKIITTVEKG